MRAAQTCAVLSNIPAAAISIPAAGAATVYGHGRDESTQSRSSWFILRFSASGERPSKPTCLMRRG